MRWKDSPQGFEGIPGASGAGAGPKDSSLIFSKMKMDSLKKRLPSIPEGEDQRDKRVNDDNTTNGDFMAEL